MLTFFHIVQGVYQLSCPLEALIWRLKHRERKEFSPCNQNKETKVKYDLKIF